MSFIIKVWSEGDLFSDDYLKYNERVEQDSESGEYFETCDPVFNCYSSIIDRLSLINESIKRLEAERDHICKYGDKLLGITSYSDLED